MNRNESHHSNAQDADSGRRTALVWLSVIAGTIATAAAGLPIVGYLVAPLRRLKHDAWQDLGPLDRFVIGKTQVVDMLNPLRDEWDGDTGRLAAYVRRTTADEFQVFAIYCTHLGCPVSWFADSGLFLCPCHGGVYYADGARASGPPPRGLYKYPYRVRDGRLEALVGHLPTLHDTPRDG
jgi:Rieske Fe-S protein